jgi:5-methylcytosine-specific restriction endonuclease McrA
MKSNVRNKNGSARRKVRSWVLHNFDTCALCGLPVDKTIKTPHPLSPEVDEIIPVSFGGSPYAKDNVQLTHRKCNRDKSNKLFYMQTNPQGKPGTTNNTSRNW